MLCPQDWVLLLLLARQCSLAYPGVVHAASLQTAPSLVAQRHAAMDKELERIARVDGWLIPAADIAICTREDGSDWLLGVGGFGQVAPIGLLCASSTHGSTQQLLD